MTVDDQAFLQSVTKRGTQTIRVLDPIRVFNERAVVECIVTVDGKQFHNIRLFVKHDDKWKLLGWANEQWVPQGGSDAPDGSAGRSGDATS